MQKEKINRIDLAGQLKKKIWLNGSFTVEASIVVPIIVFCLAALIWFVFYLRNSVKSVADADLMVFTLEQDAARNRYEGQRNTMISGKNGYYGLEKVEADLMRDGRDITVKLNITHNFPETGLVGKMVSGIRTIRVEVNETVPKPSEIARIIKTAGEIIGRLKKKNEKNGEKK